MKGNIMSLIEQLEEASDEEIIQANKHMKRLYVKKAILNVAVTVVAHFAGAFVIAAIEKKKNQPEITE